MTKQPEAINPAVGCRQHMTKDEIEALARDLDFALLSDKPASLASARNQQFDIDDAYSTSHRWSELRQNRGALMAGYKVGLTSESSRRLFSVEQPIYGVMFHEVITRASGSAPLTVSLDGYRFPRIEPELAFQLNDDIPIAEEPTLESVIGAIGFVLPAVEIVGSRYDDPQHTVPLRKTLVDIVADNGLFCAAVLGVPVPWPAVRDVMKSQQASLILNGERVAQGAADAVMGNPILSLLWLARKLRERGIMLRRGQIILSGSITPPHGVSAGDTVICDFGGAPGGFGSLRLQFTESSSAPAAATVIALTRRDVLQACNKLLES